MLAERSSSPSFRVRVRGRREKGHSEFCLSMTRGDLTQKETKKGNDKESFGRRMSMTSCDDQPFALCVYVMRMRLVGWKLWIGWKEEWKALLFVFDPLLSLFSAFAFSLPFRQLLFSPWLSHLCLC